MDEYRAHLGKLTTVVADCAKARDLKTCDPLLVGPDDRVPVGTGADAQRRLIRYGWLRVLLSKAEEPDQAPGPTDRSKKNATNSAPAQPQPTTGKLLLDAQKRLASDLTEIESGPSSQSDHAAERNTMAQVLAGRDFRDLEQPSMRDSVLERVGDWLNHLLESATRLRARSAWIGRLLVWGFILAVCVALVWALLQLERRWRLRLVPDQQRAESVATPSARDWQLWLEDARCAADAGQWREAIHFVYWAAIARLESRRLWPADRARTPREYLALVAQADPRRTNLAALTGSFERVWYGGRTAAESDYRHAEQIATALIEGGSGLNAAPEGGKA